jgi:hypothetical protein
MHSDEQLRMMEKGLKEKYYHLEESSAESNGLQADLIRATNSGIVINDARHLKRTLRELSGEMKENGYIRCQSIGIDKYSRVRQVERLADIIKQVTVN